ncbi:MAG TPA: hypothetical protein ENJ86_09815 [Methylothermaceae bacterium]|nr:hypothetical protein [Methylothermaceae bacterium]
MMSAKKKNELQISTLHDWEILGVNVSRFTRTAEIILYLPDKDKKIILRFKGVQRFFLSEMMFQNVILDVLLFDKVSDSDYFKRGCELLEIKPPYFEQEKQFKLIYFEPSVGAELACYFSDFEFIEGNVS